MKNKLSWNVMVLALLVVAIVGIAAALLVTLMLSSADRLDKQQLETEKRIVSSVVKRQLARLETQVSDYGVWDEMYDRFAGKPDPQWDIENLGPYGSATFQLSRIAVISMNGRLAYDYDRNAQGQKPMRPQDFAALTALSAKAIAEARAGKARVIDGIVAFDGRPHYVGVHAISVASEKRKAAGEKSTHALIYLKIIDDAYLRTVSDDFDLKGLQVTQAGRGMIALRAPDQGRSRYDLSWNPSNTGSQFIADSEPLLLVVAPLVAVMLVALVFGWAEIANQARDSEMRAAEARANAAEETSRAKSLFIANMSHELRTPLNAIIGFSEFIETDAYNLGLAEKYREYIGDIHASGEHLLRIVNNLLLFSKIEAKQHQPRIEVLCLADELASAMRMLGVVADRRQIRLASPEIAKSIEVLADQQSLTQIILNVVANAIKFSPAGEEVRVDFAVEAGACELRIVDRGCGIPEQTLAQLGQPFVQAEGVYARREQGTGLGLAICFALAKQMDATLTVASVECLGTTVSLRMPLADAAAEPSVETAPPQTLAAAAA